MAHRKDWRALLMPDHPTSIALKTHVAEPVPFVLYSALQPRNNGAVGYNEKDAAKTGIVAKEAFRLMEALIEGRQTWTET
jgi:2,3-bisphosphoglycerate-independent phosphoglycerate mutase